MHSFRFATLAFVALSAGFATSAASAQALRAAPPYADEAYVQPYGFGDFEAAPSGRVGQFSCGANEVHTHLEHKNCNSVTYAE